jgi:hypothetical protein
VQALWFFLVLGVLSYMLLMREKYAPLAGGGERRSFVSR